MTDPSDDRIADAVEAALSAALARVDPVPPHVADGARAAFTWRTLDAELAELSFDSLASTGGVRSTDANRQLTFRADDLEIEVMLTGNGTSRLIGQLVPPQQGRVELMTAGQRYEALADHAGRFDFDGALGGPTRLVVHGEGPASPVLTDWVIL